VQVDTPDPSVNVLANGWLVYQTLACRVWARSGYYQSGGAFGFRDQLQDVMALDHAGPAWSASTCCCAPAASSRRAMSSTGGIRPSGRGVRTHCSDDYLWLPLAVCRYVTEQRRPRRARRAGAFLEGRPVNPDDDSYYDLPACRPTASLYQHCVRAIQHGLRFGERGLPLMGSGDWNDGMNLVGMQGKGESVWLGFFLCEVLRQFAELAQARMATHRFAELLPGERADGCARTSSSTAGMASGTAAPGSTMAPRSVRPSNANAGSIRSRRAGRCSPVPATGNGRPARSRRAMHAVTTGWCGATTPWFNSSIRLSTSRP
jgi:cellobiose phosphorylase